MCSPRSVTSSATSSPMTPSVTADMRILTAVSGVGIRAQRLTSARTGRCHARSPSPVWSPMRTQELEQVLLPRRQHQCIDHGPNTAPSTIAICLNTVQHVPAITRCRVPSIVADADRHQPDRRAIVGRRFDVVNRIVTVAPSGRPATGAPSSNCPLWSPATFVSSSLRPASQPFRIAVRCRGNSTSCPSCRTRIEPHDRATRRGTADRPQGVGRPAAPCTRIDNAMGRLPVRMVDKMVSSNSIASSNDRRRSARRRDPRSHRPALFTRHGRHRPLPHRHPLNAPPRHAQRFDARRLAQQRSRPHGLASTRTSRIELAASAAAAIPPGTVSIRSPSTYRSLDTPVRILEPSTSPLTSAPRCRSPRRTPVGDHQQTHQRRD